MHTTSTSGAPRETPAPTTTERTRPQVTGRTVVRTRPITEPDPTSSDPRPARHTDDGQPRVHSSSGADVRTRVDLVVPVYNEDEVLASSVLTLLEHTATLDAEVRILVADNASTDGTAGIGARLAEEHPRVSYHRIDRKGRGFALAEVWSASDADVVAYTDVDLATDIRLLGPMVATLASGQAEVAIASRLHPDAQVERGIKRELVSRCYNRLLRGFLGVTYGDAQCGFKALTRRAAESLLPLVEDTTWFFDTELLTLAQWSGLRIQEFPTTWIDDPDSSVDVVHTALDDLAGMWRLRTSRKVTDADLERVARSSGREPARPNTGSQIMHFIDVGVLSTLLYSVGFLVLSSVLTAGWANLTALFLSTVVNTSLNRRHSFGARSPRHALSHQVKGLAVFGLCWALTSLALLLSPGTDDPRSTVVTLVAVTLANVAATLVRFVLQRLWVFAGTRRPEGRTDV